jgi:putative redox protein
MTIDCRNEVDGGFRQVIRVDAHTFYADIGTALGGVASAPNPHDYFDASLASCKALTGMLYAKKHSMALDRIEVHVDRDASREREGIYVLRVTLAYLGALSDADKQRIHDAVSRCPIHKLMTTATVQVDVAPFSPRQPQ